MYGNQVLMAKIDLGYRPQLRRRQNLDIIQCFHRRINELAKKAHDSRDSGKRYANQSSRKRTTIRETMLTRLPCLWWASIDIHAKLQCSNCHRICETCCEGGRGLARLNLLLKCSILGKFDFSVAGVARIQCVEEKPKTLESDYDCQPQFSIWAEH